MQDEALRDIRESAKQSAKKSRMDIGFFFGAKVLFSYLPLVFYFVINVPYFKENSGDEQEFLRGLFLALSYVFMAQVNSLKFKHDALGNFLYSLKIFCCFLCIASFATDKFDLNLVYFGIVFLFSLVTLFFSKNVDSTAS